MGVLSLDAADFFVDAVLRIALHFSVFIHDGPSVILCLFRHQLFLINQQLIVIPLCLIETLNTTVRNRIQEVGVDHRLFLLLSFHSFCVEGIIAGAAREALIEVTAWIGQVGVDHLEPGHVDVVLFLLR